MASKHSLKMEFFGGVLLLTIFLTLDVYPRVSEMLALAEKDRLNALSSENLSQPEKDRMRLELKAKADTLQGNIDEIRGVVEKAKEKIDREKDIPGVMLLLEDLASSAKIELTAIRPLPVQIQGAFEMMPVELEFQTEYPQLLTFLDEVEQASFYLNSRELSVQIGSRQGVSQLIVRLTVCAVFKAQEQTAGKGAAEQ